jgi:hypothetical protein
VEPRSYQVRPARDVWTLSIDDVLIASDFRTRDAALKVADLMAQSRPSASVCVYYPDATLAEEYRYHGEPRHVRC